MPVLDLRLAVPALGCWLITGIGVTCPRSVLLTAILLAVGAALLACLAGLVVDVRWSGVATALGVAGLAAGAGVALLIRADRVEAHPLRQLDGGSVAVVLRATEDPRVSAANPDLIWLRARVLAVDDRVVPETNVLVFAGGGAPGRDTWLDLRVGQPARAVVTVRVGPGRGLTAARLSARGPPRPVGRATAHLRLSETVRTRFRQVCASSVGHREAGLLPGLVVGDTSLGEANADEQFRRAGLTHLLAVSGANFALIVGAAVLVIALAGGSTRVTVCAGLAVTIAFAILVQSSPSVIRAAIMGGVGLLAMAASRRRAAMPALAAAIIAALLVWPDLAVDVGFAMSVAATAALIAWSPPLRDRLAERGLPRGLSDAIAMAAVAYVATAPLVAAISGQVSVTAIVANLLVVPVVPLVTLLGALAMVLAATGLGAPTAVAGVLVDACEPGLWWILAVARCLGGSWAAIPVQWGSMIGVGVATSGWLWWRRRRRKAPRAPGRRTGSGCRSLRARARRRE